MLQFMSSTSTNHQHHIPSFVSSSRSSSSSTSTSTSTSTTSTISSEELSSSCPTTPFGVASLIKRFHSTLTTMARLAVLSAAVIGLYYLLLVCVLGATVSVTGNHGGFGGGGQPLSSPTSDDISLNGTNINGNDAPEVAAQTQAMVDRILHQIDGDDTNTRQKNQTSNSSSKSTIRIRQTPSTISPPSTAEMIEAAIAPVNPQDHHRYTVSDSDYISVSSASNTDTTLTHLADTYADCSYHLAFTLLEPPPSASNRLQSKIIVKFSNTLSSILINLNSTNFDSGSLCVHMITDDAMRPLINDAIVRVHQELVQRSTQYHYNSPIRNNDGGGGSDTGTKRQRQRSNIDSSVVNNNNGETDNDDVDEDNDSNANIRRPLTRYFFIDSVAIEARLEYLLPTLRNYFTNKPNSYYSNALFFYSLVLHQAIPQQVTDKLILLDVDVQLNANLLELYEKFGHFTPEQAIGVAYEQQPVYRHILYEYRRSHHNTTLGSPSSAGFPGFNSGVLLLHLRKLRESPLYNALLNPIVIEHLARKYRFRGHLGDQDFYTLAAFEYGQLFHPLSCGWNRQLCQWWRFHGYGAVFDEYHRCQDTIRLYHGNCNSALPVLSNYDGLNRRRRRRRRRR